MIALIKKNLFENPVDITGVIIVIVTDIDCSVLEKKK
jgi:hypothetical protein